MLSLDFIREHPDMVREALRKRHDNRNIDELLRLAEQQRAMVTHCDGLYTTLKQQRARIRSLPVHERTPLNGQIKSLAEDIQQLKLEIADLDTQLQFQLLYLPNLPHTSVKWGDDSLQADEMRSWGHPVSFHFEPLAHWDLGSHLGILDSASASKIAGSRFMTLRGAGARMERALISFMLDVHTRDHGYTEIMPPELVKRSIMVGAGQLPKFEDQVYVCPEDELYLNPTAEVPLVGMHCDTILSHSQVPLRYAAWTTAFRREAGSPSRHTRGLLRLHQFNKVELFQYVAPEESYTTLRQMLQHAEAILEQLELSYRVIALNAHQLPFSSARTFDIEVWMPGMAEYVEVSSVSNCEDFQARRANIKYRPAHSSAVYIHTLNASGLAVGRTMAAILETYQQADGSVIVPKVLRPYMHTSLLLPGS